MAKNIVTLDLDNTSYEIRPYGVCSTAGSTAAKTVSVSDFTLCTGATVLVKFENMNTVTNPTLNVNSTGAKAIIWNNSASFGKQLILENEIYEFRYNGTNWVVISSPLVKDFRKNGWYSFTPYLYKSDKVYHYYTKIANIGTPIDCTLRFRIYEDVNYASYGEWVLRLNHATSLGRNVTLSQTAGSNKNFWVYIDSNFDVWVRSDIEWISSIEFCIEKDGAVGRTLILSDWTQSITEPSNIIHRISNSGTVRINPEDSTILTIAPVYDFNTNVNLANGAKGSIPYQSAKDTTTMLGIGSNGQFLSVSNGVPAWVANPNSDTKNTAGSTNSTSKLYLIGATSQAANPQTYSNSKVYATNGELTASKFIGALSSNSLRLTTADTQYTDGALRYYLATGSMTTSKPMGDGYILHCGWDNTGYNSQLYIPQGMKNKNLQYRSNSGGATTWGDWVNVLDSNNYASYTVKKDGTGATGTWGINISGSSGSSKTLSPLTVQSNDVFTRAHTNSIKYDYTIPNTHDSIKNIATGYNNTILTIPRYQDSEKYNSYLLFTGNGMYLSSRNDDTNWNWVKIIKATDTVTTSVAGLMSAADKTKLDSTAANANNYTHPTDGANTGSFGPSANASPAHGGTFSVPYITVNNKGHVTAVSAKTITLPADSNTDTKVKQTCVVGNPDGTELLPLLLGTSGAFTSGSAGEAYYDAGVTLNPHTNTIAANISGSSGSCTGNAATATTATKSTNIAGGTQGSIPYQTAANTTTLLAKGSANQVLKMNSNGTAPIWANEKSYSDATTSAAGLMSAADKTKLNGIATGANNYTLPLASSSALGGIKIGTTIAEDTQNANRRYAVNVISSGDTGWAYVNVPWENTTYSAATTSIAGLMSAADKTKLNGIATGANNYTHPTDGANTGSFGPSANASPAHGGTFSVPYITVNNKGHVTAASTKTITLPAQYSPTISIKGNAGLVQVGGDGVAEVGQHFDFHTPADTSDYVARISARTATETVPAGLTLSGTTVGTFKGNVTGNVSGSSGSCTGNAATATCIKKPSSYISALPTSTTTLTAGMTMGLVSSSTTNKPTNATYGNVIQIGGQGHSQLFLEWSGSTTAATGYMYYNSKRDVAATAWGGWKRILDERDLLTAVTNTEIEGLF